MALNRDESILFVSTLRNKIYAIPLQKTSPNETKSTRVETILENEPNISTELSGLDYDIEEDALYVSTFCCIYKYTNFNNTTLQPSQREDVYTQFSSEEGHGKKYLRLTPSINGDKHLLVPQGVPCNTCPTLGTSHGKIFLLNLRTKQLTTIADGVRNSVGFAYDRNASNPFERLFFTDNNRDHMGDDNPPCELNLIENWDRFVAQGNNINNTPPHYGFPYCHGDNIPDDGFSNPNYQCGLDNINYTRPYQNLPAHSAPLGLTVYQHPKLNNGSKVVLIAEHGSWNRPTPIGYKISMVDISETSSKFSSNGKYQEFATGFVYPDYSTYDNVWARPVDVLVMQDNSILVSDDGVGAIYRIYYNEKADGQIPTPETSYQPQNGVASFWRTATAVLCVVLVTLFL